MLWRSRTLKMVIKSIRRLLALTATSFYCHVLHFYVVQFQCRWPEIKTTKTGENFYISEDESYGWIGSKDDGQHPSKFLVFSDPHLLGPNVVYLDKLWHEFHMQISYKAGQHVQQPDASLILGDIFDWGMFLKPGDEFDKQVLHFHEMFPGAHALIGNHDVAFPIHTNQYRINRMNQALGRKSLGEILVLHDRTFVVLNSIGASGDGSAISRTSADEIKSIGKILKGQASTSQRLVNGSLPESNGAQIHPILVQHFPLWRADDTICQENIPDAANAHDRFYKNKPAREAIPDDISKRILKDLRPKLILSGHTHNWCLRRDLDSKTLSHPLFELSVPSFSWRNRNNPSYILLSVTKNTVAWQKCFVPRQSTIIIIYLVAIIVIFFKL